MESNDFWSSQHHRGEGSQFQSRYRNGYIKILFNYIGKTLISEPQHHRVGTTHPVQTSKWILKWIELPQEEKKVFWSSQLHKGEMGSCTRSRFRNGYIEKLKKYWNSEHHRGEGTGCIIRTPKLILTKHIEFPSKNHMFIENDL